jgi:hypothetical protein
MNRVDRSDAFAASGRSLVSDPPSSSIRLPGRAHPGVALEDGDFVPEGLVAWAGRSENGFHVQGLVAADGACFISCALNGAYQTFEVPRANAVEAYAHPFAYGCTLPL